MLSTEDIKRFTDGSKARITEAIEAGKEQTPTLSGSFIIPDQVTLYCPEGYKVGAYIGEPLPHPDDYSGPVLYCQPATSGPYVITLSDTTYSNAINAYVAYVVDAYIFFRED